MNAHAGRSSVLAVVGVTVLAISGCGGSSSPHRPKHAVFVPPGLLAGSTGANASRPPNSTGGSSNIGTVSSPSSMGATDTVSATGSVDTGSTGATATAGAGAGSAPAARVTFAAPGGQSHARFVRSADAICRGFRARARAIGASATTLAAQETELGHLVTATEQSVNALTDLSPPAADAPGLRRFADSTVASVIAFAEAQSRTRSTSEAVGSALEAKDLASSKRSSHDAAAAQGAARTLGLHVCGSPGSAWL